MDIQGYILDHWIEKMKPEKPILTVYDKEGIYREMLPLAEEKGIKVIDTTKGLLHARLAASRFWCNELLLDKDLRMIIYRQQPQPTNNRSWVEEPFSAFINASAIFPFGPQDDYKYICHSFLPTKQKETNQLFETGSTSFNMINALLDGAAYPELEQLTGGKSFAEMTVGLLSQTTCKNLNWQQEWKCFAEIQYPGLDTNGITIQDVQQKLWMYLLFSEFVFDLPESIPDSLKSIAIAPKEMKDKIYLVCDKLRNQINLREVYVKMARKITDSLHLTDLFSKAKHLGNRVTFCFENAVEYARFINYLKEGKLNEAHVMHKKNANDVWYQEDAEVATFWKLASFALTLASCINRGVKSDGNIEALIEWYIQSGYEADFAFRKYHTEKMGAINLPSSIKDLTEYVNNQYADFSERGVKEYQQKASELKGYPSLKNQGCVNVVYPALKESKRIVLVMVDALRYEMGKSFSDSIERSFPGHVENHAKVSFLPSITRFGMANHLGDISIVTQEGTLQPTIDGKIIASPEDRIEYLKLTTCVDVQDVRLENFEGTAISDNTRLLVVRSTGIDVAGENDKLNGLAAMERELIQLSRLLDECRRMKFDIAVLVADHGFMLQPSFRVGYQIGKPIGSDIVLEESRMMAGNLNEAEHILSFTPKQIGIEVDVIKFCYAKGFTVFRKGEVYYHEGLSLQENVVPEIVVCLQEERERHAFRLELKYKDKTEGTVYSRRLIVDINIYPDDLFIDDVNIRLTVKDKNGNIIGHPDGKFYNDVTQTLNISSDVAKARQTISIDDEYEGSSIVLVALDAETNATLSTLVLNFEND